MSYIKILVHLVWTTKDHQKFLTDNIRENVLRHIVDNSKSKGFHIKAINGHLEHVHAIVSLDDFNISKVMQLIKGESSYWINKEKLSPQKFEWQDEYFAVSIGESQFNTVRNYILNQGEHHKKKTFQEEYNESIKNYKFK